MQPAAPAPEPLPGAAAAAQVAAALATLGQAVASAEASGPASASAASGAVLAASAGASLTGASALSPKGAREMVIKLDPEHLGTVEIKMRLNAGKLDIEIRVANAQTLDILSRDRHVLSAAVEAAGGTQDGLSLRGGADPAQTQPQTGNGPGADGDLSRNPGAFSSHSSSEGGSRGQAGPADPFDPDIKRDTDNAPLTPHVTRSPDGSLYL